MKHLILILSASILMCILAGGAFAGDKPQWIMLSYGGSIVGEDVPGGQAGPYTSEHSWTFTSVSGSHTFVDEGSDASEWSLKYRRMVTGRLSFDASISHSSHPVRYSDGWVDWDGGEYIELQGGSLGLTPITAGVNFHIFGIRLVDIYLGGMAGLVITGGIDIPDDKEVVPASVGEALGYGWNLGGSFRLGPTRLVGEISQLYMSGATAKSTGPDAWFSELEFEHIVSYSFGLAVEL